MAINIEEAVLAINPEATFSCSPADNLYEHIIWSEGTTPIAKAEVEAKQAELQAAYDALEWKRNRQKEYPDAVECVHALLDGGDTLTDLQAQRTAIKDKYPKG
tara:strand:- start:140 stop:448 length:309 start_codon:yes stop_codon:yes gene_type:complete